MKTLLKPVRQLLLAAERGSQDDLQLLLNYPNDISPDACTANGRTALMAAASHHHCRCPEVLMNKESTTIKERLKLGVQRQACGGGENKEMMKMLRKGSNFGGGGRLIRRAPSLSQP